MPSPIAPPRAPTPADWLGWLLVALIGGSAPAAINVAIDGAPPLVIAGMRTLAAAVVLTVFVYATGRRIIAPWTREGRMVWLFGAGAGFFGYAMPFTLFPIAQTEVSSIMAGIVMACLPVMSVLLAGLLAGETLTRRALLGVLIGLGGVFILIGPAALGGAEGTVFGISLLLCAVFGYAAMGVVMRRAPEHPARSFAATMMIAASLMTAPVLIATGVDDVTPAGWLAMAYLGFGPTGFTAILIVTVVRRAGAAFLSTSAYLAPVVSVVLGMLLFAEPLHVNQVLGLLTIMAGIALTQGNLATLQKIISPRMVVTALPFRRTRSAESVHTAVPPRSDT